MSLQQKKRRKLKNLQRAELRALRSISHSRLRVPKPKNSLRMLFCLCWCCCVVYICPDLQVKSTAKSTSWSYPFTDPSPCISVRTKFIFNQPPARPVIVPKRDTTKPDHLHPTFAKVGAVREVYGVTRGGKVSVRMQMRSILGDSYG